MPLLVMSFPVRILYSSLITAQYWFNKEPSNCYVKMSKSTKIALTRFGDYSDIEHF